MFTKKHCKAIAEIIKNRTEYCIKTNDCAAEQPLGLVRVLSSDLADYFVKDNPQFDRAKFLAACRL